MIIVSIPEEMIMQHLDLLLSGSDPGDCLHHLHVVAAPADAVGPLGIPSEDKLEVFVYAIAPDDSVDAEDFTMTTVARAGRDQAQRGMVILFAALAQEMWGLTPPEGQGDGQRRVGEREALRLQSQGRLQEHPDAAEVTAVYAAARDGRRWQGRRWLTGHKAGQTEDVELLVGLPGPSEQREIRAAPLVRRLVGIRS